MELIPTTFLHFSDPSFWKCLYTRSEELHACYPLPNAIAQIINHSKPATNAKVLVQTTQYYRDSLPARVLQDLKAASVLVCGIADSAKLATLKHKNKTKANIQYLETIKYTDYVENVREDSRTAFDVVIDAGFLDSMVASGEPSSSVAEYLTQQTTILNAGGRLFIITLGQDLVAKELIRWLRDAPLNTIIHCCDSGEPGACVPKAFCLEVSKDGFVVSPPLVQMSPFPPLGSGTTTLKEFNGQTKTQSATQTSIYQLFKLIKEERIKSFVAWNLAYYKPGNLVFLSCYNPELQGKSYDLSIYDREFPPGISPGDKATLIKTLRPTIAILVPQTDQQHWLYKTKHGHQRLAQRAGCRRVICTYLPEFGPIAEKKLAADDVVNKIKQDLGSLLINLAVDTTSPVLLMTQQENFVDERIQVYKCPSDFAENILVFDAVVDQDDEELKDISDRDSMSQEHMPPSPSEFLRRTIIFQCNPRMAQTEIWYKVMDDKPEFQFFHVCHAYHLMFIKGLLSIPNWISSKASYQGAILGLGGGTLPMLLRKLFENRLSLECVDLDPAVVGIARNYFGLEEDDNLKVHIRNGLDWVMDQKHESLDFLILDINCGKGETSGQDVVAVSAPPLAFIEKAFLHQAAAILKPHGVLLVNAVTHRDRGRDYVHKNLENSFKCVFSFSCKQDSNDAIICTKAEVEPQNKSLRTLLLEALPIMPNINKLIDATPMYLSSRVDFDPELRISKL